MAFIHGFRAFSFARCFRTGLPVLAGAAGQHLHQTLQVEAVCSGISSAKWMTEAARERLKAVATGGPSTPHDGPAPDWDCTCGAYFYRTWEDVWMGGASAYAHITCLGRTMLHSGGGRTTTYSIDYLIAPKRPDDKVYLPVENADEARAQGLKVTSYPYNPYDFLPFARGWSFAEECVQSELLDRLALSLGVPVLEKTDLKGCPSCLIANKWREPKEVTPRMYKDWFGESYHV